MQRHEPLTIISIAAITGCLALAGCSAAPLAKSNPVAKTKVYPMFPSYTAENLNGEAMTIPSQLPGPTLLLVGFKRWHQRSIDGWLRSLEPIFEQHPGLDYVELPVIRRMGKVSRWFLDRAMRRGIPDKNTRARVVTLYLDKTKFRASLAIDDESAVRVYLVRPTGEIVWQATGDSSTEAIQALVESIPAASEGTALASTRSASVGSNIAARATLVPPGVAN